MFNSNATSLANSSYRFIQTSFMQQILSACSVLARGRYTAEQVVCPGVCILPGVEVNLQS